MTAAWQNRIVGYGEEAPDQLVANPRNWRIHPKAQQDALAGAIDQVGVVSTVTVNRRTGLLVDGHLRVELALSRGEPSIPVTYVDLSPEEEGIVLASLDPIAAMAGQDDEKLRQLLVEVSFDSQALEDALTALAPGESGGLTDPDTVPEVDDADVYVQPGDLWLLGDHRLLCGDSTSAEDVARLMDGAVADLVWTSPPYAQQRDYTAKVDDWDALMAGVFGQVPAHPTTQVLVNLGLVHRSGEVWPYWEPWTEWMRAQGWRRFAWYVWDQGPGLPGDWNGRLAPSFEFVFHFNREAERARKTKKSKHAGTRNHGSGLRDADGEVKGYTHAGRAVQDRKIGDSVIRVMRHKARGIEVTHPAVFPVDLASEVTQSFSDAGDIVYEPFSGSGTTIIAAETLGRRCYAMELEPRYVQVAIERWQAFTGKEATRG